MNTRWKNAVGVVIILIVSATIIAGAIVSAVGSNNNGVEKELFVDVAPTNYSSEESVIYVKRFRDALNNYFTPISATLAMDQFADKVISACSKARIPAYKLDKMATVIRNYDVSVLQTALNNGGEITEEQLEKLFAKENPAFIAEIFHGFFAETGLTGEEFGSFVYHYFYDNASSDYKRDLDLVGKDTFVEFVGATGYFLSQMKDYSEGKGRLTDSYAFVAAGYQLGSIMVKMASSAPAATVERVLGFDMTFDKDLADYASLVMRLNSLKGKYASSLDLIGMLLRSLSPASITDSTATDAEFILSKISLAKDLKKGMQKYLTKYDPEGDGEVTALKGSYSVIIEDIYYSMMYVAGSDTGSEAFNNAVQKLHDDLEEFFDSLTYLSELDLSEGEINALSDEDKTALLNRAQGLNALRSEATLITESILYLWGSSRLYELTKED